MQQPTIGRIVIYRTDGRNGLSYDLPAIVTCTRDTHPGDYPDGDSNPLPVPDEGCVHLTVLTPGGFGTAVVDGEGFEHNEPRSDQFPSADVLLPGSGTYVEWNVSPAIADPDAPIGPRTWRWPTRS